METRAPSSVAHLHALLKLSKKVTRAESVEAILDAVIQTISESLGFRTVVVNLYRREWDDFLVTAVQGGNGVEQALLGKSYELSDWDSFFNPKFLRRGAYFVPQDAVDWSRLRESYVPETTTNGDPDAWQPKDALFVPMEDSVGKLLGILSVDEPATGKRPTDEELDVIVAITRHASLAIEEGRHAWTEARHRKALEELLHVSAQLTAACSTEDVLRSVSEGIRDALGFEKVRVDLVAGDGKAHIFTAAVKPESQDPGWVESYDFSWVQNLMDDQFLMEGCFLIPNSEAVRFLPPGAHVVPSERNGRGPHAWSNHYLIVPLFSPDARISGVIWVDDPVDLLLPAREKLQALRMFANQAALALEAAERSQNLQRLALSDSLTGLGNRTMFTERLRAAGRDDSRPGAVIVVDVDDFKTVNDSLGHDAGDEVLLVVAGRIRSCIRPCDTAARMGGDEFAVLLEDCDEHGARAAAGRILETMRRPAFTNGKPLTISVSIGVACGDAGLAMDLAPAAEAQEFVLHYQPIVDLATGGITSVEALIRWNHPERGLLLPSSFISLAEETGRIIDMGRWVTAEACRQLRSWQRRHGPAAPSTVSVNLSGKQMEDPDLVESIREALEKAGLDPHHLVLECTESVLLGEAMVRRILELKTLGVQLSVDDFGTGYSSLSYLKRFPMDVLKIDRDFTGGLLHSPEENVLVQAIVHLGRALGMKVVAEGIEEHPQAEALMELGCEEGQGFFFCKPMTAEELDEALLSGRLPLRHSLQPSAR
jgi:diguanylate cyclase (GGDEF)-like protein